MTSLEADSKSSVVHVRGGEECVFQWNLVLSNVAKINYGVVPLLGVWDT